MSLVLPFSDRNLILTGYIGPHLSRVARDLSERLNMNYMSLDATIIARAGMSSINDIRAHFGENRLKSLEAQIVSEALLSRQSVIYATGRTLGHQDYLARFLETGEVFCLTVNLDAMLHRLHVTMGANYHNPQERALALAELQSEWAIRKKAGIREVHIQPDMPLEAVITYLAKLWRDLAIASR